ncbi:MAG: SDR family NAD(P)-dependent oxidoreductase [Chloroflexi bacterium]|nr:SDR family NAD(P)-dependent oxidoreductase [Chloroflexota bacterium]
MSVYMVTGCAGFIASNVSQQLLQAGHTVVGVDNLNQAYDVRLKQWRLQQLRHHKQFAYHQADISDLGALRRVWDAYAAELSGVINLAAQAGVRRSVEDPWIYVETNVTGTLNLLDLCRRSEVKKFVLASSSSLYGADNPMPYSEDANTDHPISPYAASKKAAEVLAHTYARLHDIDVTILRYFTVYGPAGRPDMSIFRFIQWINEGRPVTVFGDGQQSRDFTYVDDIARGTIQALRPLGFEIVNLGSDQPVVLLDIIRTIEQELGKAANLVFQPRHPADVLATWASIDKARELLDWQPQTDYVEGIAKTVQWHQHNYAWAKDITTA